MRKTWAMFSAVPRIADILGGLRFGFVGMQQARLLFMTEHYANALMGERPRRHVSWPVGDWIVFYSFLIS
jgi:hypothetical protein